MESRDSRRRRYVVVSWWETNQTSDVPVARVSTDVGETFGPMLMLATNGTISGTEEEGEEGAEAAAEGEGGEEGGETGEAAPETTTEQGDPVPGLD
jgi:hypothetical protein